MKLMLAKNKENQTPMDLAVESGHWDCVLAIAKGLTKKNNPKDKARCGSALLTAIQENQPEKTIESLLKAGASTTWVYQNGEGCLHWAVRNRRLDIIKLLMAHKADATAENKKNQTPFDLAVDNDYIDCIDALTKAPAHQDQDIDVEDFLIINPDSGDNISKIINNCGGDPFKGSSAPPLENSFNEAEPVYERAFLGGDIQYLLDFSNQSPDLFKALFHNKLHQHAPIELERYRKFYENLVGQLAGGPGSSYRMAVVEVYQAHDDRKKFSITASLTGFFKKRFDTTAGKIENRETSIQTQTGYK
jgi:ankyrin repeat protein